jgi:hypothetical protein
MRGLAAEFSGARLWMKVATAMFVCVLEKYSKTCSRSNTIYGLQHKMKTAGNEMYKVNILISVTASHV